MSGFDPTLYLITDRQFCQRFSLEAVIQLAIQGGVTAVQLREKSISSLEFLELAKAVQRVLKPKAIPLIINDSVEVAKEVHATGVHLGKKDHDIIAARQLLGERAIIGFSIETSTELDSLPLDCINYLALSPVFPTATKKDLGNPFLIEGVKKMRQRFSIPIVAIGGISEANLKELLETGVDGVAMVSAILKEEETLCATKRIREIIDTHRIKKCSKLIAF